MTKIPKDRFVPAGSEMQNRGRFLKLLPVIGLFVFLFWLTCSVDAQAPQHGNRVTWGAVTQDTGGNAITVDGYRVYRGTIAGQTNTVVNTTTTLSYFDTAVTAGTRYFYTLTAFKGQFESAKSVEISATAIGDPKAPAGVSATAE